MGRGEYRKMRFLITVVLLIAVAVPAYADIPANHARDNTMLLITGIVAVVISVAFWKMIRLRKK